MKKRLILTLALAGAICSPLASQASQSLPAETEAAKGRLLFSLSLEPEVSIPLGDSASLYSLGGGGRLAAEIAFSSLPVFFMSAGLGFAYDPMQWRRSISIASGSLGIGLNWELTPWLALRPFARGGIYYGFMNDPIELEGGVFPYLSAGAGVSFNLGPSLSVGLSAAYENCFGLYQGIKASLGVSYRMGGTQPAAVRIRDAWFDDLFSVFYKYYDDHPLGEAVIENREAAPLTEVKARLMIEEYMDEPKDCGVAALVKPGESQRIILYGLLKEKVLDITESTKVPAVISIDYTLKGQKHTQSVVQTVRVLDRSAMSWDDDRKAAAFVTAKEPQVLNFAKNILAATEASGLQAIDPNLLVGVALHEAVALMGMSYAPDPARPYSEMSKQRKAIDSLQFPRETLSYRAGDCDDLSILTCALMESINIETAFVTVPGHIFMAFALEMDPDEARKTLLRPDDLIYESGKAWVPVEITETRGGFLDAWEVGAREWRESKGEGQAAFIPVRDAWKIYEPVGLPGSSASIRLPSDAETTSRFRGEIDRFVNREISSRVQKLRGEIAATGNSAKSINKLGVLYARYDQTGNAEKEFQRALAIEEYAPALVNLGNISLRTKDVPRAIAYFERAVRKEPANPAALLGLARAYFARGDTGQLAQSFARLQRVAPDLAEKHSYLGAGGTGTTRAAQGGQAGRMVWAEE